MAKWAKMSDFAISVPDEPGELARLADLMQQADVNLVGLWGSGSGGEHGGARFSCVPESAGKFREFARSAGLDVEEGTTFYISGDDRPGALVEYLDRIASAGINLKKIEVVRIHGDFGGFVWADESDWASLERVLA